MASLKILRVLLFAFMFSAVLVSCSKEEEDYDEMEENVVLDGRFDPMGDEENGEEENGEGEEGDEEEGEGSEDEEEGVEFEDDCFDFVYPFDLAFPDGTIQSIETDSILEVIIDEYEDSGLDSLGLPLPVFPITVNRGYIGR